MRSVGNVGWVFLLGLFLMGADLMAEGVPPNREADHAALRTLMSNTVAAINNRDVDALIRCFARDFVFTAVDQTVLTNAASVAAFYERMLKGEDSPLSAMVMSPVVDALTRFTDANTGYCCGSSDDAYTLRRNKRVVHMTSRWTAVVVREGGEWKVTAVHTGVNFLDNPVLEARTMSLWGRLMVCMGFRKCPGEK